METCSRLKKKSFQDPKIPDLSKRNNKAKYIHSNTLNINDNRNRATELLIRSQTGPDPF